MSIQIFILIFATVLAGSIGTITGFGISTILVPVFLLFYPLPMTLLSVGIIHLFGDLWKIGFFREGIDLKLLLYFGLPGIVFSYLGATISIRYPQEILLRVLGFFLISYVIFTLIKSDFEIPKRKKNAVIGGGLSGLSAGVFGVGGAIRSAFLTTFDLKKSIFIATSGAIALFIDITRILRYITGGTNIEDQLLWILPILILFSFIGAYIAKKIVNKIPQKHFRTVIAIFLFIISIKYLLFP